MAAWLRVRLQQEGAKRGTGCKSLFLMHCLALALEELTHAEFETSGFPFAVKVLLERDTVGYAQIAHGRTPAQFQTCGVDPVVVEVQASLWPSSEL